MPSEQQRPSTPSKRTTPFRPIWMHDKLNNYRHWFTVWATCQDAAGVQPPAAASAPSGARALRRSTAGWNAPSFPAIGTSAHGPCDRSALIKVPSVCRSVGQGASRDTEAVLERRLAAGCGGDRVSAGRSLPAGSAADLSVRPVSQGGLHAAVHRRGVLHRLVLLGTGRKAARRFMIGCSGTWSKRWTDTIVKGRRAWERSSHTIVE